MNGLAKDVDWNKHIAKLRAMYEAKELEKEEEKPVTPRKKGKQLPKDRLALNKARAAGIASKYLNRDPHYLDDEYGDLLG